MQTSISFILDRSDSMRSVLDATISGFNEYLSTVMKEHREAPSSLTFFSTEVEMPYKNVHLHNIAPLSRENYQPNGMTALYDAIARTVQAVEKDDCTDKQHIVVILTDGQENSSREFDEKKVAEMVQRLEKTERWKFVFLGANQDAWGTASKLGMRQGNVASFHATDAGMKSAMRNAAFSAASVMSRANAGEAMMSMDAFSHEQKDEMENTK